MQDLEEVGIKVKYIFGEVIGGIFCNVVLDAYGKSEQKDKNIWIMGPT